MKRHPPRGPVFPPHIGINGFSFLPSLPFTAAVLAGSKPIAGASIELYVAGAGGNGSAPIALFANPTLTNAEGIASGSYACPSPTSLVYAIASGGTVSGATSDNRSIRFMTAVGPCGDITSIPKFVINEATTVAAMYALSQFYSADGNIGATATNLAGLTNAFATAAALANRATGAVPGATLPSNAAAPTARINSVANLLNPCADDASCPFLSRSPGFHDTLSALYALVNSPATNVAALYTDSQTSTAYAPALTAQPADWSLFVSYSGGGLDSPSGIAVDSRGDIWVANYFNTASEFSPLGAPIFASGIAGDGLNESYALAIDQGDNVWITNEHPYTATGVGSISELTASGSSIAGASGYQDGGLNYPLSIAIDPNGTVWVVDYGNSHVTLLNSSGAPISGVTGYSNAGFAFPDTVAIDANHNGWIGNESNNVVVKVAPDGSSFTSYDCCSGAAGIAFDQQNNAWIANYYGDSVSLISSSGAIVSNGAYTGLGSLDRPQGIAVDGAGNVWIANYRAPYLTELAGSLSPDPGASLSPAAGLGSDAGLESAFALALDASGNIWVANQTGNTITQFIGLAAPVKTPLAPIPARP
jgi:sugar lactone lactonase YvrE